MSARILYTVNYELTIIFRLRDMDIFLQNGGLCLRGHGGRHVEGHNNPGRMSTKRIESVCHSLIAAHLYGTSARIPTYPASQSNPSSPGKIYPERANSVRKSACKRCGNGERRPRDGVSYLLGNVSILFTELILVSMWRERWNAC